MGVGVGDVMGWRYPKKPVKSGWDGGIESGRSVRKGEQNAELDR